jgi:hypothetical protein
MSTDPYTQTASEKSSLSPQEKLNALFVSRTCNVMKMLLRYNITWVARHKIVKASKTSMMTTRGPSGFLTSRAMAPASCSSLGTYASYPEAV